MVNYALLASIRLKRQKKSRVGNERSSQMENKVLVVTVEVALPVEDLFNDEGGISELKDLLRWLECEIKDVRLEEREV